MNLFTLMAKISLDDKEFDKGIGDAEKKAKGFGSKMKSFAGGAVKAVAGISTAVGGALTAIGGFSVHSAMELEASEAKYKTVFGEFTNVSDQFLKDFQKLTPATTAEVRNMASGLQDLLIPMGFAREQATNMTGEFMHVIGALTNFNSGTETAESVTQKFAGALTGEMDGLKSLGIQLDADTVKQKAVEMGLAATTDEVDKQAIAQVVLKEAYRQSGDALAAYNEESLDAKTKLGLLKAQISDLGAEIGTNFLPLINGMLGNLKNGLETLKPIFKDISDGLLGMMKGEADAFEIFSGGISSLVQKGIDALTSGLPQFAEISMSIMTAITETIIMNLPQILDAGMQIITNLVIGLTQNMPSLINTTITAITEMINTFINNLPQFINAGLKLLESLITGILQSIPNLVASVPQVINGFIGAVLEMLPMIIDTGMNLLLEFINGIVNTIPSLVEAIPQIINGFINTVLDNLPLIMDNGINVLMKFIDGIINALPSLINAVPQIIQSFVSTIGANFPRIVTTGLEIIVKLISGLIQAIPKLISAVPQLVSAIVNAFKTSVSSFVGIGKNIVTGVWDGIKGAKDWLFGKVKGFFSGLKDKAKEVLDIHSPSRVFRDEVGKYMAQGVGVGFEDEMEDVNADVEKALNATVDVASNTNTPQEQDNGLRRVITLLESILDKDTTLTMDGKMVARSLAPYKAEINRYDSRDIAFA